MTKTDNAAPNASRWAGWVVGTVLLQQFSFLHTIGTFRQQIACTFNDQIKNIFADRIVPCSVGHRLCDVDGEAFLGDRRFLQHLEHHPGPRVSQDRLQTHEVDSMSVQCTLTLV